jgi:hypothetical protein
MSYWKHWLQCVGVVLAYTSLAVPTMAQDTLKMGSSAVDITPRLGTPMAGYYSPRGADGIHDPLYAKAMVLDDGRMKVAIVSLDLIATTREMTHAARTLIAERTSIEPDAVLIAATHSHTGPVIVRKVEREDDGQSPLALEYADRLPELIADAVDEALKRVQPVTATMATGRCEGIAFNRRFFMRDGQVAWNPGKMNPSVIREAGPVDEDLPLLLFHNAAQQRVGAMVNYSIHLDTVGGTSLSADMPGDLARLMKETIDPNFFTLYLTACCGDVNHINVRSPLPQKGHTEAARIATILAGSIHKSLDQSKPAAPLPLKVVRRVVQLPSCKVSDEEIAAARKLLKNEKNNVQPRAGFREIVTAYRVIDVQRNGHKPWEVEVQAISLGKDAAIVSLPGEIFVELGMSIRRASPFPLTAVAELANGSVGYIPNRIAYSQGEYEVYSSRVAEGSGEILVDTAIELLHELYTASETK